MDWTVYGSLVLVQLETKENCRWLQKDFNNGDKNWSAKTKNNANIQVLKTNTQEDYQQGYDWVKEIYSNLN